MLSYFRHFNSFYSFYMSITKSLYATLASLMVVENSFAAADGCSLFGCTKAGNLNNGGTDPYAAITGTIIKLLSLVTIVAVAYALYAGFQIMTAGGDEEKVKTGRKTIINVLIGIVVMWLAYAIVTFVLNALAG